jgi:hypothetical protein
LKHRCLRYLFQLACCVAGAMSVQAHAATINCAPDFSTCTIPENVPLTFPSTFGVAVSGDVILLESDHVTVSDVFRIFNDFFDSGGGTGLGTTAFLFSSDDSTPLPSPATYSSNAVFIQEAASGQTSYFSKGDGVTYVLESPNSPEPATFGMFAVALGLIGGCRRLRGAQLKRSV